MAKFFAIFWMGLAIAAWCAGCCAMIGIIGFQIFTYLKTGVWQPIGACDIAHYLPPTPLCDVRFWPWPTNTGWVGVDRIIERTIRVPLIESFYEWPLSLVSLGLGLLLGLLFFVLALGYNERRKPVGVTAQSKAPPKTPEHVFDADAFVRKLTRPEAK